MKYLLIIFLLASCTNAKKATRFMNEHPEVLAPICAEKFPVKDSLVKGDSVVLYDTLWGVKVKSDTIVTKDTVRITNTLPAKIITKKVYIRDTIIRENSARVSQLLNHIGNINKMVIQKDVKIADLKEQLSAMKKLRNKWRLWLLIAVGAAGMFTFLKIKKIF